MSDIGPSNELSTGTENLLSQQAIEGLRKSILSELRLGGHSVWGHGTTSKDLAERILKEGIVASSSHGLYEMAIPLTTDGVEDEENAQAIVEKTTHWVHKDAKYIVLISIPNGLRPNEVVEEAAIEGQLKTRLPNRFIPGYVDAIMGTLNANSEFDNNAQATSPNVSKEAFPFSKGNSEALPPIPQPQKDTSKDSDVW